MARFYFVLFIFLSAIQSFAYDSDRSITCSDDSGAINVSLQFSDGKARTITWKQARPEPTHEFTVNSETSGDQLWPSLPISESKAWPIGSYVGLLNGETTILTIARSASAGGGGYQWEGILTYLTRDSRTFIWGLYCNQFQSPP